MEVRPSTYISVLLEFPEVSTRGWLSWLDQGPIRYTVTYPPEAQASLASEDSAFSSLLSTKAPDVQKFFSSVAVVRASIESRIYAASTTTDYALATPEITATSIEALSPQVRKLRKKLVS